MKILVVEDDGFRAQLFRRWLRGHTVSFATSARRAIRLLSKQTFDAIFLDHDLGGETLVDSSNPNTGAEVARFIAERRLHVPVIIHSHNPEGTEYVRHLLPYAAVMPFGSSLQNRWPLLIARQVGRLEDTRA